MIIQKQIDLNNPESLSYRDMQLLNEAKNRAITFDCDCPETTDEELEQMYPKKVY